MRTPRTGVVLLAAVAFLLAVSASRLLADGELTVWTEQQIDGSFEILAHNNTGFNISVNTYLTSGTNTLQHPGSWIGGQPRLGPGQTNWVGHVLPMESGKPFSFQFRYEWRRVP